MGSNYSFDLTEKEVLLFLHLEGVIPAWSSSSGEFGLLLEDEVELGNDGPEDVPRPAGSAFLDVDGGHLLGGDLDHDGGLENGSDSGGKFDLLLFRGGGGGRRSRFGFRGGRRR